MGDNFSTKKEAFLVVYEKALAHRESIRTARYQSTVEAECERIQAEARRCAYERELADKEIAATVAVEEARAALLANTQDVPDK